MFNQILIDGAQKTAKPYTVVLSLLLQISAICALILIPLVYTGTLPSAQLKSLLMAAPPPRSAPPAPARTDIQPKAATRQFDARSLIAPRVIPKQVNPIQDAAPTSDTGVVGSTIEPGTADSPAISSLLFGVQGVALSPPPPPKRSAGPLRIGGVVARANLIHEVQPIYPPLAKSARVQGTVEFTATISKDGNIENLQLVHGHPLLVNAAKEAVLQWKYRPTLLNGQAVEVITNIVVNFTLRS